VSDGPEPTHDDVPQHAIPATYRRAPRTERFILTGVGIGAFVGLVLGLILPAGTAVGRGTAGLLLALAGALVGGLITGAQAAVIEYTSGRSADRQRVRIAADIVDVPDTTDTPGAVPPARADAADPASHAQATSAIDDDEGAGDGSR